MLHSDELIFLHLQKTGGNHVARILGDYVTLTKHGKHGGLRGDIARPYVLVGIRNPWDWYVSLWAYGCQDEGTLFAYLTDPARVDIVRLARVHGGQPRQWRDALSHIARLPGRTPAFWRDLYRDSDDADRFRRWLRAIHADPTALQTGEDFSITPLRRHSGLLTARYLRVISRERDWDAHKRSLTSRDRVRVYREAHSIATHFIRTERLEDDLFAVLSEIVGSVDRASVYERGRTNPSARREARYYYDDETAAFVAERDAVMIAAHGYSFDALA